MDVSPGVLRDVLCTILRKMPDPGNWSQYPNIWGECQELIEEAAGYRVYDFAKPYIKNSNIFKNSKMPRTVLSIT